MDIIPRKKNIILGEKLSPDRKKRKKEPKHTLIEFGLYRGLIMVTILSLLNSFGILTQKQLNNMIKRKLGEDISRTKISNMLKLLRLWRYVKKERVTKRLMITEKGKTILEKSSEYILKLVNAVFNKEFII